MVTWKFLKLMTEGTLLLQDSEVQNLTSMLTEYAKVQRAVGNQVKADQAEAFRKLVYQQTGELL
jgi:hypothetical protein